MKRILLLLLSFTFACTASAAAQEKNAPRISVALKSADELMADLKFILDLTKPASQKQWQTLKEYLQFMVVDLDMTKPVRIDIFPGGESLQYRSSFPVPNFNVFLSNTVNPVGIDTRRIGTGNPNDFLYRCGNLFDGYLLYIHNYAVFSEKREHVPLNLQSPASGVAELVANYDLGMRLTNPAQGVEDRSKWFEGRKTELLAAVKKQENEDEDDFALRKLLAEQQFEELGRIYAEAAQLTAGWNTDAQNSEGRLNFELSAIKNTSLAESVGLLGAKPSYFVNVPATETSILSFRANHPLDPLRRENLLELLQNVRSRAEKQVDVETERSDEQKTAAKSAIGLLIDLIEKNARAGLADGFVDVRLNPSGKKTTVGAFRAEDPGVVSDALELLPKAKPGQQVELDADKQGEVRLHRVSVSADENDIIYYFLEGEPAWVGTSESAVWFATGEEALQALKAAIQKTGEPVEEAATNPIVHLSVRLRPWLEQRSRRAGEDEGDPELRKLALESILPDDDRLTFEMRRLDQKVSGEMTIQAGVLRLAGEKIAGATAEYFSE